jgi:hypothetical protein
MDRPYVLLSRFQGNERDGHGNHQTAGLITTMAFKAAGDPSMFPEQIREGLRPWQPLKVYIGGVRENEAWTVAIDSGEFSPWLGDSYNNFARLGLSFQRSQNGGRYSPQAGPSPGYYSRVGSVIGGPQKEAGFFDGIDTTIPGLFKALRVREPEGAAALLGAIDRAVKQAVSSFSLSNPAASVAALTDGLAATRAALRALSSSDPDALFVLRIKEQQFQDAITTALGLDLVATAQPANTPEPTGPFAQFAAPPSMPAPVPGQTFDIRTRVTNRSSVPVVATAIELETGPGWAATSEAMHATPLGANAPVSRQFTVALADDAPISSRPYYARESIQESRYALRDPAPVGWRHVRQSRGESRSCPTVTCCTSSSWSPRWP